GEDLWVPIDSLSKQQEKLVLSYFNDDSDYAVILIDSPSEGGNLLTKEAMDAFWGLNSLVMDLESSGKTYEDLCVKQLDGTSCEYSSRSVTRFWGDSLEIYTANVTSDADVLEAINVDTFPDGATVSLEAVFGNTVEYDSAGDVTSARAMTQIYLLDVNTDEADEDANEWMTNFQDLMSEQEEEFASIFGIKYITGRSIDDALEESVSGETFLFVTTCGCSLAFSLIGSPFPFLPFHFPYTLDYMHVCCRADVIMLVVVMVSLGRCCSGSVRRRSWLGLAGVGIVVAAGLAAYGINSGFGIPFTTLASILPFILIGIGVDDMFVIVAAFDHTDPSLPVEERMALSLKRSGVSITYTSLTNFAAFMLGSTTSLPAVEYFCIYAGTAILFDFVLQMTAFVAFLTMDVNRQAAGRVDLCCCFKNKKFLEEEGVQRGVVVAAETGTAGAGAATQKTQGGLHAEVHQLSPVGRFMKEKYTPFLLSVPGKIVVLLGSAALLAAGIYGVTQATQGFEVLDLAPDDHYARDYTNLAREYDLDIDSQFIPVGVYSLEVDYPDVGVQAQMQQTDDLMEEQRYISGPIDSWLSSFLDWAANETDYSINLGTSGGYQVYEDRDTFYPAVGDFLEDGDNQRFQDDIVFKSDGSVEISRSWLFLVDVTDTDSSVDALEDTRDVTEQSALDPEPFGFSSVFVFVEQFLVIYDELIENFILALAAVVVLSLLVLGKVGVVVLVCFTVVMIDIELLGFVYHWGLDVNSITVIELIMAVGLVVDYMVHIVHFFLHQAS
ncbi:unnamed protein product, partial [Ascophyllum nodosum]